MPRARTLLLLVALAAAGCGGSAATEPAGGPGDVRHAGLYYLGDSFEGLPLTHAESSARGTGFFVYGTCEPAGSEGGCATPLQVQNYPITQRHPSKFQLAPGTPSPCRRTSVRGVPAAVFGTTGGALEVYAGETVAVISADARQALRAARALRRYEGADAGHAGQLPQPPGGVKQALRRCAADSYETNLRELRGPRPIYWLGERFERHPLARVEGSQARARFVYGDCARALEFETDGGCWAPLELVVEPLAASRYAAPIKCRWTSVRGVPVAVLPSAATVQVFSGRTTVTMYAREIALMLRAVSELRTLDERRGSGRTLPGPPRSLLASLAARCARMRA